MGMGKKAEPSRSSILQLRLRAEAVLAYALPAELPTRSAEELLHELRVYQIELEMQNETLRETQVELEKSRDCYTDLYDFVPVGYLTLTPDGLISKINLAGAAQLQMPREKLIRKRFASFIAAAEDQDRWHHHFFKAKRSSAQGVAELALRRGDGSVFHAQIDYMCRQPVAEEMATTTEIPWIQPVVATNW